MGERPDSRVDGELEANVQAEGGRPITQVAETLQGAGLLGFGAHHQDVLRPEPG
jgi:hypothetical protein